MTNFNPYTMKLFEEYRVDCASFLIRVMGGWVFSRGDDVRITATFIPFNNEFMSEFSESESQQKEGGE